MPVSRWAIVQHSGGLGFEMGLEEAAVTTVSEIAGVEQAGGRVFETYSEASDYCMTEQYPPSVIGLYPRAPGSFSSRMVGNRRVYIPL
ncbi:MAG: hypothetical protein ABJA98_10790 [Acidobacteriota bacterium]